VPFSRGPIALLASRKVRKVRVLSFKLFFACFQVCLVFVWVKCLCECLRTIGMMFDLAGLVAACVNSGENCHSLPSELVSPR